MVRLTSSPARGRFAALLLSSLLALCVFQSLRSHAARIQSPQRPIALRPDNPAAPQVAARQMPFGRDAHTATLLPNGKLLIAGGRSVDPTAGGDIAGALNSCLLYDPTSGVWADTGSLRTPRFNHAAVLLQNGRVLMAGGQNADGFVAQAEIYDPATGLWTNTGALKKARGSATLTLLTLPNSALPDAKALIAGGENSGGYLNSFELFDPAAGTWTEPSQKLNVARRDHTALRLSDGSVLVAGGGASDATALDTAEVYNPNAGVWRLTAKKMNGVRRSHTATLLANGKALVAGGGSNASNALDTCEIYDPASQTWEALSAKMTGPRRSHSATLMPDGKVLAAFGQGASGTLNTVELFDPTTRTWSADSTRPAGGGSADPRVNHTASLLAGGRVLLVGGSNPLSGALDSAEFYESKAIAAGKWAATASMQTARFSHTATLLTDGRVLVAGGDVSSTGVQEPTTSSEIYDPVAGTWTRTGDLNNARLGHTATILLDGRVLVAGGADADGAVDTCEVYDPATGVWTRTDGELNVPRQAHTATLLRDGRVLVTGGRSTTTALKSAEVYNLATERWTPVRDMNSARQKHTATTLPNGLILVAAGVVNDSDVNSLMSAEYYDPAANTWTNAASSMVYPHKGHTATLLPSGKVLVTSGLRGVGGQTQNYAGSAEIYDPGPRTWSATATPQSRYGHAATLLSNGKVILTGGVTRTDACGEFSRSDADIFDPATGLSGQISSSGALTQAREFHTATLLSNGQVLVAGGRNLLCNNSAGAPRNDAELFDQGLSDPALQTRPVIANATWTGPGAALTITGVRFQGVSESSEGGAQSSATNIPVAQLRSLTNDQIAALTPDPAAGKGWTNNGFVSTVVPASFPPGPAALTVFVNGVPSFARVLTPNGAAPQNTISISGRAYDVNGLGFQSTVMLRSSTGLVLTAQTSATGEYIFTNLPAPVSSQAAGAGIEAARQDNGISYTITPAGAANNGQPVTYSPASVTVNATPSSPGSGSGDSLTQSAGVFVNQNFWAQYAMITVGGAISGLNGGRPPMKLQLLNSAPYITVPDDQKNPTTLPTATGAFQFTQCLINGMYKVTPMSSVYVITPTEITLPPLAANQAGLNFSTNSTCQGPAITTQPVGQSVCAANPAMLSVAATGSGLITYQWRKDGVAISGANSNNYSLPLATPGDIGVYDVVVGNECGTVISKSVSLNVNTFSLSEASASFPISGGSGSVFVIASVGQCGWAATSSANWITINSGASGAGNGTINYTVAANSGPGSRTGAITLGGLSFIVIVQAGATPQITALSRQSAYTGAAPFPLTVTGSNFTNSSKVRWNGSQVGTTFVSATQLTANITAAELSAAGTINVDVLNVLPGATPSNALPFTVLQNYEADVNPRPDGNGSLSVSDWVQVGRFVAGLETPANGGEFQRADCAPRLAPDGVTLQRGNGAISVADWTMAGLYAAGQLPLTPSGGPTEPAPQSLSRDAQLEALGLLRADLPRKMNLSSGDSTKNNGRSVSVTLDALGAENALGFSVSFDATRWRFDSIAEGPDAGGAQFIVNTEQASGGHIGVALAMPTGESLAAGRRLIATINFTSLTGDPAEFVNVGFSDRPVAREIVDVQANPLPASYSLGAARPLTVVSAASFDPSAVASESIVAAFGSNLAAVSRQAETLPLPTQLGDAQVNVRDSQGAERWAPMFFASPGQINFQIPAETATGIALVTVIDRTGVIAAGAVEIAPTAPGLFSADATGRGLAAGLIARAKGDGPVTYEPVARFDAARQGFVEVPIDLERDPGEQVFLLLFGSGFGRLAGETSASIGGAPAEVTYLGPQGEYAGLDQVNIRLSRDLAGGGAVEVKLVSQGRAANPLTIHIK